MPNPVKMTRPENAKAPFEILNMDNSSEAARINIYDIIGQTWWDDGVTGKAFANEVSSLGKERDLVVHINSLGGDVVDGTLIYNTLLNHEGKITFIIDGWAASMASIIPMVPGCKVKMSPLGMMMIHKPLNNCRGNADAMRKNAETLDKVEAALTTAYTNKTKIEKEAIAEMLTVETWMTAEEALDQGFIDEIIESTGTAPSNCLDPDIASQFVNVPKAVLEIVASDETDDDNESEQNNDEDLDVEDEESNDLSSDDDNNVSEDEPDATEVENHRVLDIMNQCQALGLEHMAQDLIKNKTSIEVAGTILSNVKAGIDNNNQTHGQHKQNLETTMSNDDIWNAAKQINKR